MNERMMQLALILMDAGYFVNVDYSEQKLTVMPPIGLEFCDGIPSNFMRYLTVYGCFVESHRFEKNVKIFEFLG